jgi:homoserine O-succinyltransferase
MTLLLNSHLSDDFQRTDARTYFDTKTLCRDHEMDFLDIAFINNMPPAAFNATERQYVRLLTAAAGNMTVRMTRYSLRDIRDLEISSNAVGYLPITDLWEHSHDALIMTGTEPRAANLANEDFWPTFTAIVDWARYNRVSAIWSCLAAHAAVLHLDRVERHPLDRKCCGFFSFEPTILHPLLDAVSFPLWVQHSRWNGLVATELTRAGYTVLTQSSAAGVDTFVKEQEGCLFVFFQGHPEYGCGTLMREYRRDVGRFLGYERNVYPGLPEGCLDAQAIAALSAFRNRAVIDRRLELLMELPSVSTTNHPSGSAARIYRNWLSALFSLKQSRPPTHSLAPSPHHLSRRISG